MLTPEPTATTQGPPLGAVVADVLGNLAFMVQDDARGAPPTDVQWLECTIAYRGPLAGRLHCWCTRAFAVQLAANLLGLDPASADARESAEDALREFMNVLCGQLVTTWHGTGPIFSLSIPEVRILSGGPASDEPDLVQLIVSGQPFAVRYEKLN